MSHYASNTLDTVIFRVDFVNPINVEDDALHRACLAIYPVSQNETVNEQSVQTSFNEKGEMIVNRSSTSYTSKKYSNRTLSRYITVSPRLVLTEVKDYISYDDTSKTFLSVFNAIRNANPDVTIARIGMRYINRVDLTAFKKTARKNYVKNVLFESAYDDVISGGDQARTQHLAELIIDDYRVRCITGLFNPDYPAAIKRSIVTLDFDAFIQGNVESADVQGYLDKFHDTIQKLYEASIFAKQRELMGVIENE